MIIICITRKFDSYPFSVFKQLEQAIGVAEKAHFNISSDGIMHVQLVIDVEIGKIFYDLKVIG